MYVIKRQSHGELYYLHKDFQWRFAENTTKDNVKIYNNINEANVFIRHKQNTWVEAFQENMFKEQNTPERYSN